MGGALCSLLQHLSSQMINPPLPSSPSLLLEKLIGVPDKHCSLDNDPPHPTRPNSLRHTGSTGTQRTQCTGRGGGGGCRPGDKERAHHQTQREVESTAGSVRMVNKSTPSPSLERKSTVSWTTSHLKKKCLGTHTFQFTGQDILPLYRPTLFFNKVYFQ